MQLGIFLKRFRSEVLLSGEALAKRIGVKRHSLEKWENNGILPAYNSSVKIQNYFGIQSLVNISEEVLRECVSNELKLLPAKTARNKISNEGIYLSQEIVEYLHSLSARIDELEKLIETQNFNANQKFQK